MPAPISHHDAWRAAFHAAVARGYSPTMAAVIASEAFPDSVGAHNPARYFNRERLIGYSVVGVVLLAFCVGVSL
jgi:hypothetical protein